MPCSMVTFTQCFLSQIHLLLTHPSEELAEFMGRRREHWRWLRRGCHLLTRS